jgi:hypothetical protein
MPVQYSGCMHVMPRLKERRINQLIACSLRKNSYTESFSKRIDLCLQERRLRFVLIKLRNVICFAQMDSAVK